MGKWRDAHLTRRVDPARAGGCGRRPRGRPEPVRLDSAFSARPVRLVGVHASHRTHRQPDEAVRSVRARHRRAPLLVCDPVCVLSGAILQVVIAARGGAGSPPHGAAPDVPLPSGRPAWGYRTQTWKRTWRVAAAGAGQNPPAAARMVERVSGWGAPARKEEGGRQSRCPERRRNASNVGGLRDLWRSPAPFTNRSPTPPLCCTTTTAVALGYRPALGGARRRRAARPPRRGAPRRRLVECSKPGCAPVCWRSEEQALFVAERVESAKVGRSRTQFWVDGASFKAPV